MTTEAAPVVTAVTSQVLDARTLLVRVNARIAALREWLSHDHRDEPYWWARKTKAPAAQREREFLRQIANLLHVERAHARGRVHGTHFASLDAQATWLDAQLYRSCVEAAVYAGLRSDATLLHLRERKLSL
jgi:hypothetical protein